MNKNIYSRIFMSTPDVGKLEEESVLDALRSGWVAPLGPAVDKFESDMCERVGAKYAVALSSGTAALHLGLLAWNIGRGSVVPCSTLTFAATANAIVYTGAEPFFVDCNLESGNIDIDLLDKALCSLINSGKNVPAIIPVDLLGKACDYTALKNIQEKYEIKILVDAAESLGASVDGIVAGNFGDASIFSFNGNKIMTTSGGGMFLTNDKKLANRVRYLSTQARQPVLHYEHTDIGFNYRMSNILASLGVAQLKRLDNMIAKRKSHREAYKELFQDIKGVKIFGGNNDNNDNYWLTSIIVEPEEAGWMANSLMNYLAKFNIETRPIWKPMHRQPVFRRYDSLLNGNAEYIFEKSITLPSGSALTEDQFNFIIKRIKQFLAL